VQSLFTPWRLKYIRGEGEDTGGCFLCAAARDPDDPERLVVHRTARHQVILNRHPYTAGHVMVAPLEHVASPLGVDDEAQRELWPLVLRCQRALTERYHPHGFNLGMNLGRCAGAGVPDHFHLHLVPRWDGDTNFISVVGGVRLVPEPLDEAWRGLRALLAET